MKIPVAGYGMAVRFEDCFQELKVCRIRSSEEREIFVGGLAQISGVHKVISDELPQFYPDKGRGDKHGRKKKQQYPDPFAHASKYKKKDRITGLFYLPIQCD